MNRAKRIILILFSFFILTLGSGVVLTYLYSDEIKQYGVSEINKLVRTEIQVDKIDFSVFQRFPSASLIFYNVRATEVGKGEEKGQLFKAETLYLEFNILDLIRGNYTLKSIVVENGMVNLRIDKNGNSNFDIFKETEDENEFALALEKVLIEKVQVNFTNEIKQTTFQQFIEKAEIQGKFSNVNYDLAIDGITTVQLLQMKETAFIQNKTVFVDFQLFVDNDKGKYSFKEATLSVQDMHFFVNGDFTTGAEADLLNFNISGNELSIPDLLGLFPEEYKNKLKDYEGKGEIKFSTSIKGFISNTLNPELKVDFNINNGSLKHNSSGLELQHINLNGNLWNGHLKSMASSQLIIDTIEATLGKGKIWGSYDLLNFDNPYLKLQAETKGLNLREILEFFPNDSIESINGLLDLNLKLEGKMEDIGKFTIQDFRKARTYGKATLSQFGFSYLGNPYKVDSLNANLEFNNNDVKVSKMNFIIGRNDFYIDGFFKNLIPYLLSKDEQMMLRANYKARHLYWDDFMSADNDDHENSFAFPDNLSFDLNASIEEFQYKKLTANDFKGRLQYSNQRLIVPQARFKSMQGEVNGQMQLDARNRDEIILEIEGNVVGVDITQLFDSFDQFGQEQITSENLKGICNAEVKYRSLYNHKWEANANSIDVQAHLKIEDGQLINYKPVYALSRFIEVEELNHINFASLENDIRIQKSQLFFPEMNIKSSALNLTVSGKHGFNNEIEYHFSLLLRDLLSKKARKAKKENEEFGGHVEDDGLGRTTLFLKMTGTVDDPRITYDRKGLREQWKEDLQNEKQTIKKILKEEFGKNTEQNEQEEIKEYDFEMEWEEGSDEEDNTNEVKKEEKEKEDASDKKKSWLDKISKPNKDEYEEYDPEEFE